MKPLHVIKNKFIIHPFYDLGCNKGEGFEFLLNPAISISKAIEDNGTAYGLAVGWGFWAINFIIITELK